MLYKYIRVCHAWKGFYYVDSQVGKKEVVLSLFYRWGSETEKKTQQSILPKDTQSLWVSSGLEIQVLISFLTSCSFHLCTAHNIIKIKHKEDNTLCNLSLSETIIQHLSAKSSPTLLCFFKTCISATANACDHHTSHCTCCPLIFCNMYQLTIKLFRKRPCCMWGLCFSWTSLPNLYSSSFKKWY